MEENQIDPDYYFQRKQLELDLLSIDNQILGLKFQKERIQYQMSYLDNEFVQQDAEQVQEEVKEDIKPKKLKKTND